MKRLLLLSALSLASPVTAIAGPASDAVKFFYSPEVKFAADPEYRSRFTAPVTGLFELNDKAIEKNPDQLACIDFDPSLDAQDFDQDTVDKTLKLSEKINGTTAEVTATFNLFAEGDGSQREILWSMNRVDGEWKIADISSKTNDWKLSELGCVADGGTD